MQGFIKNADHPALQLALKLHELQGIDYVFRILFYPTEIFTVYFSHVLDPYGYPAHDLH